jgi:3-oxoacyl-[acyl-carrier-protein] synthase-1
MTPADIQQEDFQRPTRPVEIAAIGMLTPVGANAKMTAASVRAGISAYQASAFTNKSFNPMTMALVPEDALPPLHKALVGQPLSARQQRMLRLATPALLQAVENIRQPLPLMLCGPEKMPGRRSIISDRFLQLLATQAQLPLDLQNSYVFPEGRASGLHALEAAMQLLEHGQHQQVLVGGVDSYLDLQLLAHLDKDDRVLADGVMDGFAPGEGAAFLVLQLAGDQAPVRILPPGIGEEPGHRYSAQPYLGEGLAQAISEALSHTDKAGIRSVFSSFNGESFSAKEWSVAALRNQSQMDPEFHLEHPADCYGDLGGATVPVLLALASIGMTKGYYPRPSLVWASSEIQQRAAVLMT